MNRQEYEEQFERWVGGSRERKRALRAELTQHLDAAETAGELGQAMERLGSPRHAAKTFAGGQEPRPARIPRRLVAALIDLGIFIALFVGGVSTGTWSKVGHRGRWGSSWHVEALTGIGVALMVGAIFWWIVLLPLLEWRYGRTAGKALLGLRVVAEDGTAPSFGQIVLRRLTLVFSGPLQIIDWAFMFFTPKKQRAFDILAHTLVVSEEKPHSPTYQTAAVSS